LLSPLADPFTVARQALSCGTFWNCRDFLELARSLSRGRLTLRIGQSRLDELSELLRRRRCDSMPPPAAHDRPGDRVELERSTGVEVFLHRCAHVAAAEVELATKLQRLERRTLGSPTATVSSRQSISRRFHFAPT
jgi:hypothetical protein